MPDDVFTQICQCKDATPLTYTRRVVTFDQDMTLNGVSWYATDTQGNCYEVHVTLEELHRAMATVEGHECPTK